MLDGIKAWLEDLGLGQYAPQFKENDIDLEVLAELSDADLKEIGVNSLGHRKRILKAARGAASTDAPTSQSADEGERRQLTVLFVDLVESSSYTAGKDPEDVKPIMNAFKQCCERVIKIFGGYVARYEGDALLVYFGYPSADEHDPERAILAGLEMARAVGQINVGRELTLRTRVGIATGSVVLDLIGEGAAQEHEALGETLNIAKRLQGIAEPDTVVIGHSTQRLVRGLFKQDDLGLVELKGLPPIQAWRVTQVEDDVDSRFEATRAGTRIAPLLGRNAETDLLLERWNRARGGSGQAILIIGEPGIGKSRLSTAFRDRIFGEPHSLLQYYCVPFQQESALFPVVAQLERAAGITRGDPTGKKLRKIEIMVGEFAREPGETVPLYADLMGVPVGNRYPPLNLGPRLRKERIFAALTDQLEALAREQPVLAIFEDLHWVDPSTLELIERTLQRLAELPALILMTGRPEFLPSWPTAGNFATLHLDRLGDDYSERLIGLVTQGKALPDAVTKKILEKTDGVPLFVEELTKTLLESGMLEETDDAYVLKGELPDHEVPSTLHDSLMARLDRLGLGKKIAQIGAAIGRVFSYDLLTRVSGVDRDKLDPALERLAAADILHRTGVPPRAQYMFKHALIQDTAYSTLLKTKRRELHKAIATAIEHYEPDTGRRQPEVLAYHYTQARELIRGIPYWERAARKAIDRAAHSEAQKHIEHALKLLKKLPDDSIRMQLELGLQTIRGVAFESTLGYMASEVADAYDRARELCEALGRRAELVPVLLGLYVFNFVRGDFSGGRRLAQRALELSNEADNRDYKIEALAAVGYLDGHMGNFEMARAELEECIALYESRPDGEDFPGITAQDPCVATRSMLPIFLWQMGYVEESEEVLNGAFQLADRLESPINYAVAHVHAAEFYHMRRQYDLSLEHAQKAMKVCADHGYEHWQVASLQHLGLALATDTPNEEGLAMAQQGLGLWQGAGARVNCAYFKGRIAWCLHVAGCHKEAQEMLDDAFRNLEETNDILHGPLLLQLRGDMAHAAPLHDDDLAETSWRQALELAQRLGVRIPELRAMTSLHALHQIRDRESELTTALTELIDRFPPDCALPDLADARAALETTPAGGAHSPLTANRAE